MERSLKLRSFVRLNHYPLLLFSLYNTRSFLILDPRILCCYPWVGTGNAACVGPTHKAKPKVVIEMRWFSSAILSVTLLFSGSAAAATVNEPAPSSAPIAASALVKQVDQQDNSTEKNASPLCQLLPQLCEDLPELEDLPKASPAPDNEDECNPLSSWCLWDPFYGSCEWDAWYGVYVCGEYFYREGYECWYDSRLDWQWVCREEGGGWWW